MPSRSVKAGISPGTNPELIGAETIAVGSSVSIPKLIKPAPQFLVGFAEQLACFAAAHPEIEEVEINPLMVLKRGQGVFPVDALIRVAGTTASDF